MSENGALKSQKTVKWGNLELDQGKKSKLSALPSPRIEILYHCI